MKQMNSSAQSDARLDEKNEKYLQRGTFLAGGIFVLTVLLATGHGFLPDQFESESLFSRSETESHLAKLSVELWRADYDLDLIRDGQSGVPRYFVATWPRDWASLKDSDIRKKRFLKLLLPLILQANEKLLSDRKSMVSLASKTAAGEALHPQEESWRARMALELGLEEEAPPEEILQRLDIVPPSLALAQSAIETGWGSSRFVREGNALFGEWSNGDGMVPAERAEGENHTVRRFDSLSQSVASYLRNLNTHPAYEDFRQARFLLRKTGLEPDGEALSLTLKSYSEQGETYLALVRELISDNDLSALDAATLAPFGDGADTQIAEKP